MRLNQSEVLIDNDEQLILLMTGKPTTLKIREANRTRYVAKGRCRHRCRCVIRRCIVKKETH
jgi:hypothetical protein